MVIHPFFSHSFGSPLTQANTVSPAEAREKVTPVSFLDHEFRGPEEIIAQEAPEILARDLHLPSFDRDGQL